MKKFIIILAAAVCALAACQKNEIELLDKPIIEKLDNGLVSYTFTAVIADDVSDAETKATIERNGSFAWAKNDALKFYESDGTAADAEVTAVDGSTATITVTTTHDRANFVSAIYPASAAVAKDQISFNNRGPIVVSAVNGGTLDFHHIGSLVKIKFTSIPAGTASLVFKPASAFGYDGHFDFSERVPRLKAGGTTSEIVVSASTADEGKDITICVPNVTLTGGFSATLNNNAAGTGRNLFKKSTATAHNLSTGSPVLLNMKSVACTAPSVYYLKTVAKGDPGTNYWSKEGMPLIKNGTNTYSITVNADRMSNYYVYDEWNTDAPTTHCIASGSTTSDTYSTNSFALVGEMNEWNNTNTDYPMNKVGNWSFGVFDRSSLHDKEFKFTEYGSSDWTKSWGQTSKSWFNSGTSSLTFTKNSGNDTNSGFWFDTASSPDKLYLYFNESTGNAQCYNTNTKSNPLCALTQFDFNSSSGTVTVTVKDQGVEYPFGDASYPRDTYGFKSAIDGWASVHSMTYDNNWGWKYNFTVPEAGTSYQFLLSTAGDTYLTQLSATWSTVNVGSNLYGRLSYWGDDKTNPSVTFPTSGNYTLFVNPTYAYDHSLNIMFVEGMY